MTDVYRNFPYERTTYAQYQGYMKTEVEQVFTSPYRNRIILVPYNEPDGNWFAGLTTNADHARRVRGRVAADLRLHQGPVAAGADRRAELQRLLPGRARLVPAVLHGATTACRT